MAAKKTVKRIVLVIVAGVVVVIVALGIFISTFDINKYKPTIEQKASAAIGYNVTMEGDMKLKLFPSISVEVKGLHIENPEKFKATAGDLLYVEKANVGLALMPLLSKKFEFSDLRLTGVNLNLIKPKDGAPNWDLNKNKAQAAKETALPDDVKAEAEKGDSGAKIISLLQSLSFKELAVKNTAVKYYDLAGGGNQTFDNLDFTCGPFDSTSKPLQFSLSARLNNTPLSVKGQLTSLTGVFEGAVPFNVDAAYDKMKAQVEGKLALASDPMLEATLTLPAFSPKDVMKSLLPSVPDIIAKAGANAFTKLETTQKITVSAKKVISFSGPFTFDQTGGNISGSFSSKDGVQNVTLNLDANQINLNNYLAQKAASSGSGKSSGSGGSKASGGIPSPADIFGKGALAKMDLTANIKLNQATFQDISVSGLTANAKLNKGYADASFSGKVAKGELGGSISGTYNSKNNIHNASINADVPELNLDSFMGADKSGGGSGTSTASSSTKEKKPILDPQTFNKLNIAAKVKLNKLIFKGLTFNGVNVNANVNQGKTDAAFSLNYGNAPLSGNFSGNLTAQNSQKALVFKTSGLPVAPFLKAFMNKDLLGGALTADINVNGTGMDVDDLKRSLTGRVAANVANGQIKAGPVTLPFDRTTVDMDFSKGKGDFTKGEMTGNTIAATFSGWINLANDTLDVSVKPTVMPVDVVNALLGSWMPATAVKLPSQVPFRVSGAFKKPSISLDISAQDIVDVLKSDELKDTLQSLDPENLGESLKQGVQDKLNDALPGSGGLVEGLFGGKKDKDKDSGSKQSATTSTPAVTEPATPATETPTEPAAVEETKPAVNEEQKPAAVEEAKPAEETKPAEVEEPKPAADTKPAAEPAPEPEAEVTEPAAEAAPAKKEEPAQTQQNPKDQLKDAAEGAAKELLNLF